MQTINLYRYTREDGGVTVSTVEPSVEYTVLYRLVADEGMILTNGENMTVCVDTDDVSVWTEIQQPIAERDTHDPEYYNEILEKARAYDTLMGEVSE